MQLDYSFTQLMIFNDVFIKKGNKKMGKTISITLPLPLVNELQRVADIKGISRSRLASNILLHWQEEQETVCASSRMPEKETRLTQQGE